MARQHNFSAGPAVLPASVIAELQEALPEFAGTGMGLMELSHRSKPFGQVVASAEARLRRVLGIPEAHKVLLLQGGASLQFYMAPLNLLAGPTAAARDQVDFLLTGTWTAKAIKEAARVGDAQGAWDGKAGGYVRVPREDDYTVRPDAVYLHYCSNNTIYGTQFHETPAAGGARLVADMSSDIASRPIDVGAHDVIFAGAQKNLGPSGVTAVILSPWAQERAHGYGPDGVPSMLSYRLMIEKGSMFNTPNTFGIYALERVLAWVEDSGGPGAMATRNLAKARHLYEELDRTAFWRPHADVDSRSHMNVTWRLPTPELDAKFVADADSAGLKGLKGHRSVGGIRASIYNACGPESVAALVSFMAEFERTHG